MLSVATLNDVVSTDSGKCVLNVAADADDPRIGLPVVHPYPSQNCISCY